MYGLFAVMTKLIWITMKVNYCDDDSIFFILIHSIYVDQINTKGSICINFIIIHIHCRKGNGIVLLRHSI